MPIALPKTFAAAWPAWSETRCSVTRLGAACLALLPLVCAAQTGGSLSSLDSAFKPGRAQAAAPGPAAARASAAKSVGATDGDNLPGLRVLVSGPNRTVASIDGKLVRVGDKVNGMRVTKIDRHAVVLVGEGGVRERLTLNPEVSKHMRPASAEGATSGVRP